MFRNNPAYVSKEQVSGPSSWFSKMQETDDLIARLERASGPNRALGNLVLFACGWTAHEIGDGDARSTLWASPRGEEFYDGDHPNPTASIDAALMLVPEGYRVGFEDAGIHDGVDLPEAWCWPFESDFEPDWKNGDEGYRSNPEGFRTVGATPAIAICIAALRSRAMTDEGDTK